MKLHEWRGHAVALMLLASGCVPEESDLGAVTPSERLDPVYEEEGDWLPSTDPAEDGVDEATLESSSWGDAPMSALPDEGDAVGDAPAGEPLPFGASSCGKYFAAGGAASSKWVSIDGNGNLQYRKLNAQGDHIMDFSYAGYGGGGAALPSVAAVETVKPSGADDTAAIAAAINRVSGRKLVDGHRGAVVLAAGTFHVNGALQISASGVVLRGSGSGNNGTVIQVAGSAHRFLRLAGGGSAAVASPQTSIVDSYVPSGSRTIHVASASGFKVGDEVLVGRPVTQAWIHLMGMDKLVRHDKPQTWIKPGSVQTWQRKIAAISGSKITLDIPLSDSLDSKFVGENGGRLTKVSFAGRISQVGVEHLRVVAPPRSASQQFSFIAMDKVVDSWLEDVRGHNFTNGVSIDHDAQRITVDRVALTHDHVTFFTAAAPSDFAVDGQQVLVSRSSSDGGNKIFYFVTHPGARGPNVVVDFSASGEHSHLEPHQRWATGLLIDRAEIENGGIGLANRGTAGSGHGWTIGWSVAWNCAAGTKVLQPPGATNWAIGCTGSVAKPSGTPGMSGSPDLPLGEYDSQNKPVHPDSLYLAQLCARRGPGAVASIGY